MFDKIKNPKKRAFLAAYSICASVSRASRLAEIDRTNHYLWIKEDSDYVGAFEEANLQACQALEDEATRRAHEGVEEPVWYQGEQCGSVLKYSDTLMIFLLKGRMPEKYRENIKSEVNLAGKDGKGLIVQFVEGPKQVEA